MKIYTKEEAIQKSTDYFNGNDLAAEVFVGKYCLRNDKMEYIEDTPEKMHLRLAKEFAQIEKRYSSPISEKDIFELLKDFRYVIPQGSPMFGIGNPYQNISLSNCFVIDTVDSYGGICRTDERIAQISKRRGGVGLDISPLRPKGQPTRNSAFTTDGIVVFMQRFSNTSREVAQSGRRGALMISISVHHPEILNFIKAKTDLAQITGANISVRITDEFMDAVKKNKKYELRWPVDSKSPSVSNKIEAQTVWNEIIKCAHKSGEPGVLFWDTIIRNSPADCYAEDGFKTFGTNPCGELPTAPQTSCILMLLNLSSYVLNPFTDKAIFNIDLFKKHVGMAMKLSDDLVDLELESISRIIKKIKTDPEDKKTKENELALWMEIKEKCKQSRRTGLGLTAMGDCIAMLNVKYGSKESIGIVKSIYSTLRNEAYSSSVKMAKDRGAFPIFNTDKEKNNEYLNRLPNDIKNDMRKYGRRNIACLTTSPAGSVSTIASIDDFFGTSSGFEPVFKVEYKRKRKLTDSDKSKDKPDFVDFMGDKWKEYTITHSGLKLFKKITGKEFADSPYNGSQAEEIDYRVRVEMQALATEYTDHAISSTINLPKDVGVDTVGDLYMDAWTKGCKGLTIYRAESRDGVLTEVNNTRECEDCDEASKDLIRLIGQGHRPSNIIPATAPKRPTMVECDINRSKVDKGDWLFFVGRVNNQPYEVFGGDSEEFTIPHKYKKGWICKNGKDKNGVTQYNLVLGSLEDQNEKLEFKGIAKHFNNYQYGAFTRLVSLAMRHGTPVKYICEQITKKGVEGELFSFQRAMSRVLKKYIAEGEKSEIECPECHSRDLIYKNGCPTCQVCGQSNCS